MNKDPSTKRRSFNKDYYVGILMLLASFWIGNVLRMILNVPLIGVWMKLLQVPYRFLFPAAMFFIAVGVYSTTNNLFEVGEVLVFSIVGAVLIARTAISCAKSRELGKE